MSASDTQPPVAEDASPPPAARSLDSLIDQATEAPAEHEPVNPSVLEICRAMGSGVQLKEVLDTIISLTTREMKAQQGSILLFDEHKDRLQMLSSCGLPPKIVAKGYIPRKGSIAEWVIEHAEPLILNERAEGEKFQSLDSERRIVSSMCVPLRAGGDVIGTINLNRTEKSTPPFCQKDLDGMVVLASQAAIYIDNSRLHHSLLQSERLAAIGQTVAGISHCMKNLITGMKGGLSLSKMARENKDWDILGQGLDILSNSVSRVSSLALDMLNYSKDREPELAPVNLDELLAEVRGVTRDRILKRDGELVVTLDDDAHLIEADGDEIFRCMLNLVENAIDANDDGGKVFITAERSSAEGALRRLSAPAEAAIIIRIADEGGGIPEEDFQNIFDPFFSTKGTKGTGLGLAVTRKIIHEHGGSIEVASRPDQPAVFAIFLPAPAARKSQRIPTVKTQ